ncbi:MAG: aspartate 1-decarboxylase [Lentisphaerae bacterium]|nr:aspartate 1-decarboxylase [Lentisphaerota bacterium]
MYITLLKGKIHRATITESDIDYEGSLKIDPDIMDMVKIRPYEKILVANINNGERFETYAIPGKRGSKVIGLNGATTHKGSIGDRVIVFAFCQVSEDEAAGHSPLVLVLDENNEQIGDLRRL